MKILIFTYLSLLIFTNSVFAQKTYEKIDGKAYEVVRKPVDSTYADDILRNKNGLLEAIEINLQENVMYKESADKIDVQLLEIEEAGVKPTVIKESPVEEVPVLEVPMDGANWQDINIINK